LTDAGVSHYILLRPFNAEVYYGAIISIDCPWEPPLAGTEVEHLVGALNRLRTTFRWKADDLDAAGLRTRIGSSSLTLGGLLKHLALIEDYAFTTKLSGKPIGPPWDAADWKGDDDWEFTSAAGDTPEQLYALWDGAVERPARGLRRPLPARDSSSPSTSPGPTVDTPACVGSYATSSKSMAVMPDTPICSARKWTDWLVRTRQLDGTRDRPD
jgi:hypothetical protein